MKKVKSVSSALLAVVLVLLLSGACTPKPAPTSPTTPTPVSASTTTPGVAAPAPMPLAKKAWQEKWESLIGAAQREGVVVFYNTIGPLPRQALASTFYAKYGVKLEIVVSSGSALATKILAERRAGIYGIDVYSGGASTAIDLKLDGVWDWLEPSLIVPELTDPEQIKKVWWGGQLLWVDPAHYILASLAGSQTPVVINTDLVKPEEIKSYQDLLAPKWKGKMVMLDPTVAGFAQNWVIGSGEMLLGWDYMRQLAKQEPVLIRDSRIVMEWVVRGKYAIGLCPASDIISQFVELGAPVKIHTPKGGSGISTDHSNMALLNRAPHPNAAKLFINWIFTKETQTLWSQTALYPSLRLDVPTEHIDPQRLLYRAPGEKYVLFDQEEFQLRRRGLVKYAEEIFGPLKK